MDKSLAVSFISYDQTRTYAGRFLDHYHPSRTLPIPIERIIDNRLAIDIVPIPGLLNLLKQVSSLAGFIAGDLKTLYVDEYVYRSLPNMYRFTLAHEIGHAILHRNVFKGRQIGGADEWIEFMMSLQEDDYSYKWYEMQANNFAGLALVPENRLEGNVRKTIKSLHHKIEQAKKGLKNSEMIWEYLSEAIADEFGVSAPVIDMRIKFDKLKEKIEL